jgi:hypothetical protein
MSTNRTSHPHRQYVFRARHDRRRIAQRLAASLRPSIVAALEGTREADIQALLGDAGFARLVRHCEELRALAPEARVQKLMDMAMEVMELALEAGDVRVALFVMAEGRAGRHPAETLAKGVVRSIERAVPQVQMRPGKCKAPPAPRPDRSEAPERSPQAKEHAASPAAVCSEQNFGFSAVAQPTPADAQALAMVEAEKLRSRIQATGNTLRRRIIHEMERIGTLDQREVELRAFAKAAHKEPERALRAAAELERRRTTAQDVESQAAGPAPGPRQPGRSSMPPDHPVQNEVAPRARPRWPPGTTFMANTRFSPFDSG